MGKKKAKKQQQVKAEAPFDPGVYEPSEIEQMVSKLETDALYAYVSAADPYLITLALNAARAIAESKGKRDDKDEIVYNVESVVRDFQYLLKRDW